jgi:large subunit ribosomal protein L6e
VPLRRVNQAYVIATSTKLDVAGVKLPESVNDAFFSAEEERKTKSGEESFFALQKAAAEKTLSEERKALQAAVDGGIKGLTAELKAYLKSTFSLRKGDKPHEMAW